MTYCVSVQVSESFGKRQHDPSGMKSLKTCCLLQSLEACWVLCASVSLLTIWKGCYLPNFHGWKMFLYTKLCYCKLGLIAEVTVQLELQFAHWNNEVLWFPSTMKGVLCIQVHHLLKDSTSQGTADPLNYCNFTNTLLTKNSFFDLMRTMNVQLLPQQWIIFLPSLKFFFIFRNF